MTWKSNVGEKNGAPSSFVYLAFEYANLIAFYGAYTVYEPPQNIKAGLDDSTLTLCMALTEFFNDYNKDEGGSACHRFPSLYESSSVLLQQPKEIE